MIRYHQGKDRTVRRFPVGSRRQGRVERYCCNVICGAPTTPEVKGLRWEECQVACWKVRTNYISNYIDRQKKRYNQNQGCFIHAVISSSYFGTNETNITRSIMFWRNLKLYAEVPSNWHKPWPKFDVTDATFEFEFPEDLDTMKD